MAEEMSVADSQRLTDNIEVEGESNTQTQVSSHYPEHAKKRKLRSTVWNDFDRIEKDGTFVAECRHCHKKLSGDSKIGTTHLRTHLNSCVHYKRTKKKQEYVGQMLLRAGDPTNGNMTLENFQFNQESSREELAKMFMVHEVPFSFAEHAFFRSFCSSLQPQFKCISRTTVKSDCLKNVRATKDCLELFYRVTKRFSGSKYPTANLYFNDVCLIHSSLKKWLYDSHPFIVSMATRMLEKFNKYWSTLSLVLSFGCILDPRYKLKTIEFFFDKIYLISEEYDKQIDNVRAAFVTLYEAYVQEQRNIYAGNNSGESESVDISGLESTSSSTIDVEFLELDLWLRESNTNKSEKTDLQLYFELPVLTNYSPNFDILAWWRDEEEKLPILAKMARDILSIPVSTVASESAFSTGGRILDSYRSSLKPATVESLICCQDWIKNASKGSTITLGTIPLAPKVDAEDVVEEDVILQPPSNFNDDEDDELEHNFAWFWKPGSEL